MMEDYQNILTQWKFPDLWYPIYLHNKLAPVVQDC